MTDADWASCSDPQRMLSFLRDRGATERKLRLFVCAVARRVWPVLDDPGRSAVGAAERLADGRCPEAERAAAYEATGGDWSALYTQAECIPAKALLVEDLGYYAADAAASATRVADADGRYILEPAPGRERAEAAAQADLLRCIFGDPFRPMRFDPSWRADTAVLLARQMYESREFGAMPILADALQDAGCQDEHLLNHCRGANVHVHGCFVVDLVLGKV